MRSSPRFSLGFRIRVKNEGKHQYHCPLFSYDIKWNIYLDIWLQLSYLFPTNAAWVWQAIKKAQLITGICLLAYSSPNYLGDVIHSCACPTGAMPGFTLLSSKASITGTKQPIFSNAGVNGIENVHKCKSIQSNSPLRRNCFFVQIKEEVEKWSPSLPLFSVPSKITCSLSARYKRNTILFAPLSHSSCFDQK